MEHDRTEQARELHSTLEFIGLRAQATTVGLLQLCAELVNANVLDDAAIARIKNAIFREIAVNNSRGYNRAEFERTLRERLDAIFPRAADAQTRARVGTTEEMRAALDSKPDGEDA